MDYPIKFGAQLKEQLRSLRKARGLSQTDVGALLGVNQRRIADIESKPGSVGFDQVMKLVSALGAELVLRDLAPSSTAPDAGMRSPAASVGTVEDADDGFTFAMPSPESVPHLLASIKRGSEEERRGPFWDETQARPEVRIPLHGRRLLISHLARALWRSPKDLEAMLLRPKPPPVPPEEMQRPVPMVLKIWADSLGVTPQRLRQVLTSIFDDRMRPAGLGKPPAKGSW